MKRLLPFILLLLTFSSQAQVHIGPTQMYKNIQAAAAVAKPGDTLYVHAGEYTTYQFYKSLQGTPSKWITIMPYGSDSPFIRNMWQFTNLAYVRFIRLSFQGNATYKTGPFMNIDNGGDCALQSHDVLIDRCYFGDNATGNTLKFGGLDNFEVKNCTFKNQGDGNAGLAMNVCHNGWVHNNYFENVQGRAIQTKLGTRNITFERNLVKNCGTIDAALRIGEAGNTIYHCPGDTWTAREIKIYSNIVIGGRASFSIGQAQNCSFVNNTFINPTSFVFRILAEQPEFRCDSNLIRNNIFYLTNTRYFNATTGTGTNVGFSTHVIDHNLFYYTGDSTWKPDPNAGVVDMEEIKGVQLSGIISGNPRIVNTGTDFHLKPGSPAIKAGAITSAPNRDFYDQPYGNPPSVGAVEYGSVLNGIDHLNAATELTVYPNPAKGALCISFSGGLKEDMPWLTILSIDGKVYFTGQMSAGKLQQLDISTWPDGLYVLQAGAGYLITKKFMVQH